MILKRKTSKGKIRYGVRVDRYGKQDWIGTFPTLAEARHAEAKSKSEGHTPTRMTCDKWTEFYLEGYRMRVKDSSYGAAVSALKKFSVDYRGIPLIRVDKVGAERWARENRWRVPPVIALLNAAVDAGLLARNPFAKLAQRGEGRKRNVPLTVAELDELATAALRVHGAKYGPIPRALILFLAYTGVRPGEAFALEWDDVDFEHMRVQIERRLYRGRVDLPKSNRPRPVVLPPPARDALLSIPRSSRFIFTAKRGGQLSQSGLAWIWRPVIAGFGKHIAPYELRHFAAHHLYVTMNLPARVVAAQLGHEGPKLVEELYGHGDVGALDEIQRAYSNVVPLRRAQ